MENASLARRSLEAGEVHQFCDFTQTVVLIQSFVRYAFADHNHWAQSPWLRVRNECALLRSNSRTLTNIKSSLSAIVILPYRRSAQPQGHASRYDFQSTFPNTVAVLIPLKKISVQYKDHERNLTMLSEGNEQGLVYNKNLKAAIRRAVNAPVVSC